MTTPFQKAAGAASTSFRLARNSVNFSAQQAVALAEPNTELFVVYKDEGNVPKSVGVKELSYNLKPGKYKLEVTNNTPRLFGSNASLRVDLAVGEFSDQSEIITKQTQFTTIFNVPFGLSEEKATFTLTSDDINSNLPYKLVISQIFYNVFQRQGYIGNGEKNKYDCKLSAGQYCVYATSLSNVSYGIRYKYSDFVKEEVKSVSGVTPFRSKDIIIRAADAQKRMSFRVKGSSTKECFFTFKLLQSVGVQEIQILEDQEKNVMQQQFKEILDFAIANRDVKQLQLMITVVESKGYVGLKKYAEDKIREIEKVNLVKEKATALIETTNQLFQRKEGVPEGEAEKFKKEVDKLLKEFDKCPGDTPKKEFVQERAQFVQLQQKFTLVLKLTADLQKAIQERQKFEIEKKIENTLKALEENNIICFKKLEKSIEHGRLIIKQYEQATNLFIGLGEAVHHQDKQKINLLLTDIKTLPAYLIREGDQKLIKEAQAIIERLERTAAAYNSLLLILKQQEALLSTSQLNYFLNLNSAFITENIKNKLNLIIDALLSRDFPQVEALSQETINEIELIIMVDEHEDHHQSPTVPVVSITKEKPAENSGTTTGSPVVKTPRTSLEDILKEDDGYEDDETIEIPQIEDPATAPVEEETQETDEDDLLEGLLTKESAEKTGTTAEVSEYDDGYEDAPVVAPIVVVEETPVKEPAKENTTSANRLPNGGRKTIRIIGKKPIEESKPVETAPAAPPSVELVQEKPIVTEEQPSVVTIDKRKTVRIVKKTVGESPHSPAGTPPEASKISVTQAQKQSPQEIEPAPAVVPQQPQPVGKPAKVSPPPATEPKKPATPAISAPQKPAAVVSTTPTTSTPNALLQPFVATPTQDDNEQMLILEKVKQGETHIHMKRKALHSHPLIDKLHTVLVQVVAVTATQQVPNVVNRSTPFGKNVVEALYSILTFKLKKKMFWQERTLYDVFKNFNIRDVQLAVRYFEQRQYSKIEFFIPESMVMLQFLLETGDLVPFVNLLLQSEMYLGMCYQNDSILVDKKHRDDLVSILLLLQQLRFDLGYLRHAQQPSKPAASNPTKPPTPTAAKATNAQTATSSSSEKISPSRDLNAIPELVELKKICKNLVQVCIKEKKQRQELSLKTIGSDLPFPGGVVSPIGSMIRLRLAPTLEMLLGNGTKFKSYQAGPYHIWNILEFVAKNHESLPKTQISTVMEEFLNVFQYVHQRVKAQDPLQANSVKFKTFVACSLNNNRLSDFFQLCILGDANIIQTFYGTQSILNEEKVRERITKYLSAISKLPFDLNVHHEEILYKSL